MSAGKVFIVVFLLAALVALFWGRGTSTETVFEPQIQNIESQPPCAWNNADTQLTNWFPGATGYVVKDAALSGKRMPLQERIGRPLRPDEMLLRSYVVRSNQSDVGTVLTRRFKGEHGAIEFVVGLDTEDGIRKFEMQRTREPAEVLNELDRFGFERRLQGKSVKDDLLLTADGAPLAARKLAKDLADELKTLLVLYEAGRTDGHESHH